MKKSHVKIISKIESKISYYELLTQGQFNDGDNEAGIVTNGIIQGLRESVQIIKALKQKDVNKSILKEAEKYLCLDEYSLLDTINFIIADYNESGDKMLDWVQNVQIIEKFEHTFSISVFLYIIGIKHNKGDKIDLLIE